jgi:cell fate regulator YaaT (PSP1 superfamily)
MGCACGTKKDGQVSGCKNNGACSTGGCNKMNVFDWLSNMEMPVADRFDIVEVRFKNGGKDFFRNPDRIDFYTGDPVIVEVQNGHHLGHVSLQGELVRLQMKKKNVANDGEIRKIYRIAHQKDLEKYEEVKKRETPSLHRGREIIREMKLNMKLSDVEYQADNMKASFFYSADERVDFRELIKVLAGEFRIRVEMRQISLRQEAGRLGGIGVCGRELCCSTWLTDFKNVATSAARYQNLSLNPSKLSGQCGRLKCCLNYELETYMDALKHIPEVGKPLLTEKGEAVLQKTDIFRQIMWFGYKEESAWYPLNVERVNEILALNQEGRKPATLELNELVEREPVSVLNSDLAQLDKKFAGRNKKKPRNRGRGKDGRPGGQPGQGNQAGQAKGNNPQQQRGNNPQQQRGNNPQQPRGNNPQQPRGNNPQQPRGNNQQQRGNNPQQKGSNQPPRGNNPRPPRGNNPQQPRNNPPQNPDQN